MNCLYCGGKLPTEAAFCPACGSPIVGEEPETADPMTAERRRKARMRQTGFIVGWIVGISAVVATATTLGIIAYKKRKLQA
jgi:hypothetical protein